MMARRGTILVVVLLMTAMAAMAAAGLMFRMRAEVVAAGAGARRGEQAYAAAMSGIQRAVMLLQAAPAFDEFLYDNPDVFQSQLVCEDGANSWYFTIYAEYVVSAENTESEIRYGLTDEAGKININAVDRDTLLALPNMTEELVDCLLDYRDGDNDARPNGAEQEYYEGLEHPYAIKNGPVITLEELLLVKGFNGRIIYGEDANLNGLLEPNEDDAEASFPPDDGNGELDTGLRGLATAISYGPNVDNEGQARAFLNGGSQAVRRAGLSTQTQQFIDTYLSEGNQFKHPSELLHMEYQVKKDQRSGRGSRGGRGGGGVRAGTVLDSGVGADELPVVMDKLTTLPPSRRMPLIGLVNVNTAPPKVLAALPGLDVDLAQRIVEARADAGPEDKATIAWLFTGGVISAETFKTVAPRLTARGYQYHIRCIGFGSPCGRYRIIEAVVDLAQGKPRITYLRDITRLGLPFPLDVERKESAR